MAEQRVVLVDGVAGYWGGRVAERLLAEPDLHVIGLDTDAAQAGQRHRLHPEPTSAIRCWRIC